MNRPPVLIAALLSFILAIPALCAAQASPITVQIVNNSAVNSNNIYVLLTSNNGTAQVSGITCGTPTLLSSLANSRFTLTAIQAGRLTFSYYNQVAANQQLVTPSPRFDKVEFTYPGTANLTAVDFFGIPFKMETLDASGNVIQTLNYYTSQNTLLASLLALAPTALVNTSAKNGTFARILSPSVQASAYPSLQNYVKSVYGQSVRISWDLRRPGSSDSQYIQLYRDIRRSDERHNHADRGPFRRPPALSRSPSRATAWPVQSSRTTAPIF